MSWKLTFKCLRRQLDFYILALVSSSQVIEVGRGGCVHFFGSLPAAWNHLHHKCCRRTTSFLYRRRSISVLLHCLAFQSDSASTCKTFYREILLQSGSWTLPPGPWGNHTRSKHWPLQVPCPHGKTSLSESGGGLGPWLLYSSLETVT